MYEQDLAPLLAVMFPPAFAETSAVSPGKPHASLPLGTLTPCLSQRLTQSAAGNASRGTWKGSIVYSMEGGKGELLCTEPKVQKRPRFTRTFQECSGSHQATFPSILFDFKEQTHPMPMRWTEQGYVVAACDLHTPSTTAQEESGFRIMMPRAVCKCSC